MPEIFAQNCGHKSWGADKSQRKRDRVIKLENFSANIKFSDKMNNQKENNKIRLEYMAAKKIIMKSLTFLTFLTLVGGITVLAIDSRDAIGLTDKQAIVLFVNLNENIILQKWEKLEITQGK